MRSAILVAVLGLWPALTVADSITRVSPSSLFVGAVEEYITVHGTGLAGAAATMVEYSGPLGTRVLEPNATTGTTEVTSWLPIDFGMTVGRYSITILAIDSLAVTRRIGPAFFDVVAFPILQPPLINVPEMVLVEATSPAGAVATFNVFGLSFVDPAPVIACSRQSGSQFSLGPTTVVCSATDSFGSISDQFTVMVSDTVHPTLVLPASFSTTDPLVTYTVTASDAIDGALTPSCSPASGSTFPNGVTSVRCTATDSQANTATGSFNVTVTVLPILNLPTDFSVEADGPAGTIVNYLATADGGAISCTPPSGALFPLGVTVVECSATSPGGTSTGTFSVTVEDTTPPIVLYYVASPSILWAPNHKMTAVTFEVAATDSVSAVLTSHIESITSNQPVNGEGDGNTDFDWLITGPLTADLRAERSGGTDRIYTITIVTVDESGNLTRGTVEVKVSQSRRRAA